MTKQDRIRGLILGLSLVLLLPAINLVLGIWVFDNAFQSGADLQTRLTATRADLESIPATCNPLPDEQRLAPGAVKDLLAGISRSARDMLQTGFSESYDMGVVSAFHLLKIENGYTAEVNRLGQVGDAVIEIYYGYNEIDDTLCRMEGPNDQIPVDAALNAKIQEFPPKIKSLESELGGLLAHYKKMRPKVLALMWLTIVLEVAGLIVAIGFIIHPPRKRKKV